MRPTGEILALALLLTACSDDPAPKDGKAASPAAVEADTNNAVKTEKKSLEEAADAAAKLVEAESQQEMDAMKADSGQ
jgi:PBP1b-binding outer membrane lipoprotein LpoB